MQKFQPIYIYAQSLDNTSEDLIYQISYKEKEMVEQINDLPSTQHIMSEINAAIKAKNNINHLSNFAKNHTNLGIAIHHNANKVLIKLKTNDKDNIGRHSPISILLDTTNLSNNNAKDYIDYFHRGLVEFCHITGRQPKNTDFIKDLTPEILLELTRIQPKNADFIRELANNLTAPLSGTKTKRNVRKPDNKWLKAIVVVAVIIVVIWLLKHYIYQ